MNDDIDNFIISELKELETRDIDALYVCIAENLETMGIDIDEDELYNRIETHLKKEIL